ncbi:hypothetical protein ACQVA2_13765 [Citrobacter sp. OP27]
MDRGKAFSVTGGSIDLTSDAIDVGEEVDITATATTDPEDPQDGSIHYEWLLTDESGGLTLTWDGPVAKIGGTAPVVEKSGTCSVTCTANGTALDGADISITQLPAAPQKAKATK